MPSSSSSQGQSGAQSAAIPAGSPNQGEQGRQSQPGDTSANSGSPSASGRQSASGTAGDQGELGANPGQDAGTQNRLPGNDAGGSPGRDSSTGDLNSGNNGGSSDILGGPSGDYSLDTLPDGVLSGNSQGASGNSSTMTTAERAAVLDERLRRGYETFDGFILGERERAQAESNAAGSAPIGSDGEAGGGAGNVAGQPQTIPESGASPSGVLVASQPATPSSGPTETFSPPDDIPSGRDDDVVARQLREAAMSEPDPELREALWQEYRNYTGLGEPQ